VNLEQYNRKSFRVQATVVTEENMVKVAQWCDGTVEIDGTGRRYIKVNVNRPTNDKQTMAYAGDWVLKAGKQFKVYEEKAFKATFEPAKGYTVTNSA
jgi:hypothetical protein